jgi:cell division septal protein FtsQ
MAKYRSKILTEKRKKMFLINSVFIVAFFISANYLLSEISKIEKINIKEINIKNTNTVDPKNIKEIVKTNLDGNYFWRFYSKKNILIYPKQRIKEKILSEYSEIKEIDLNLDLPNTLNVDVLEYKPYALWCKTDCYLIDKTGYLFKKTKDKQDFFEYQTSLPSETENTLRSRVFKEKKFDEIDSFVKLIEGSNLNPTKLVSEDNKKYELYFNESSKIIFNDEQNIRELMDNFQAVLNIEDFYINNIEYIDLRFGNKVFYK